jgi:flagellar biosynthesis GTPase FlhF
LSQRGCKSLYGSVGAGGNRGGAGPAGTFVGQAPNACTPVGGFYVLYDEQEEDEAERKAKQEEPDGKEDDLEPEGKKPVSESKTEYEKAINRLKAQLDTVQSQLATEKKEKEEEQRRNLERIKKDKVIKGMIQNGVTEYPEHLYMLTKDKYRLEGTGEDAEVVGGDEYEPVPLDTILGNLRDNKEYKRYFSGSGLTGSGMTANEQKTAASKNPFRTDNFNQTECSVLLSTDKARAKRLIGEARAAGKLDTTMAKAIAKMSDMN